jgi:hypothetical protein
MKKLFQSFLSGITKFKAKLLQREKQDGIPTNHLQFC